MKVICRDRRRLSRNGAQAARGMSSISPDLDKLLAPKNHEQLETLEKQVRQKLRSDEAIDVDYWENLLTSISIYKAKARLRQVSQSVIGARLDTLRNQQAEDATAEQNRLRERISTASIGGSEHDQADHVHKADKVSYGRTAFDPDPLLKLTLDDKSLPSLDTNSFTSQLVGQAQTRLSEPHC